MMSVRPRTAYEIQCMRVSNHLLREVFADLEQMIAPGVTTAELNLEADRLIRSLDHIIHSRITALVIDCHSYSRCYLLPGL